MLLRDSLLFPDCLFVRNCLPPCSCCHRGATTALRLVRNQRRGCRPEGRLYAHISAPKARPESPGDGTSAFYMPLRLCRARGAGNSMLFASTRRPRQPATGYRLLTTDYWLLHRLAIERDALHLLARAGVEGELDGVGVGQVLAAGPGVWTYLNGSAADHRTGIDDLR